MSEDVFTNVGSYQGSVQDQIVQRLVLIQSGQTYLIERVNKINGSIKDLYNRTEENEKDLIRHTGQCALRGRVEEIDHLLSQSSGEIGRMSELRSNLTKISEKVAGLDSKITEQIAQRQEASRLVRLVQPAVVGLLAALLSTTGTLVLLHSSDFLGKSAAKQTQQSVEPSR